jgi:hypothetical protein
MTDTLRAPLVTPNGEYQIDAIFSDDGRLIDLWIEAEGPAADIDEDLWRFVIQNLPVVRKIAAWRRKEIEASATVIEDEETEAPPTVIEDDIVQAQPEKTKTKQPAEDTGQASLPF